jgi:hypothetical protein
MVLKTAESWTIEELVEFLQDRDLQMDDQVTYFDVAEEVAVRLSTLLATVRHEESRLPHPSHRAGHMLYTDEIREVLADREC